MGSTPDAEPPCVLGAGAPACLAPGRRAKKLRRCRERPFPNVVTTTGASRKGSGMSQYRWVIVTAGGVLGCVAIGAMFSLPVFLGSIVRDTGWSMTGVSSAMTIAFLAMAATSVVWGNLSDRFGTRFVVVAGS